MYEPEIPAKSRFPMVSPRKYMVIIYNIVGIIDIKTKDKIAKNLLKIIYY